MQKVCQQCKTQFEITSEDLEQYKKFEVDPQDLCFDCDQKQRLLFRNERVLYNRKCDATGENIVSIYAPDKPFKVYKSDYWYGDKWDPMAYGRDFDFNKTFFEQLRGLNMEVPRVPLVNVNSENSDYCNMCAGNKNCYLVFGGDFNRDCMYGTLCMNNSDSLDIDYSNLNELCYTMDNSMNCYGSQFVWDSKNCSNCAFIADCIGCTECILCTNLINKSYCIENVQYSKEEYFEKKKEILTGGYARQMENWKKFLELRKNRIVQYGHILSCENCVGDYLKNNKNCHNCFDVSDSEDIRNSIFAATAKDCFNVSLTGHNSELVYNSIAVLGSTNVRSSYFIFNGTNIDYSEQIINGQDLFGCNGIKRRQYCILNKQYTKEEYLKLVPKIIEYMKRTGEWGKFFPKDFSCFAYNESTNVRYYPLSKEKAISEGFQWREENKKSSSTQTYQIPDNIKDVLESVIQEMLACETCAKNFKMLLPELQFYKKQNIPVPHKCPECRQKERISLRNGCKMYKRTCMKCGNELMTTYAPARPETIYCEKCYQKERY